MPLSGFVNKTTLEVDVERWTRALLAKADLPATEWRGLEPEIIAVAGTYACEQLVRGHDLATLIAVGARSVLGSRRAAVQELAVDIEIAARGTLNLGTVRGLRLGQRVEALEAQLGVRIFNQV